MKKKYLFTLAVFLFFCSILGAIEISIRQLEPTQSFSRLLFFNQFKISRWGFLNKRKHELNADYVINVIAMGNADFYDRPELFRPPFDRVPESYLVRTNPDGFRERKFPKHSRQKSIVILGDSVGFGKGVPVEERFSSIIQQQIPNTPIYNLSLLGCTADCMAQVLEKHIEALNPSIIVVQTSGNDIDQTLWREGVKLKNEASPDMVALSFIAKSFLLQKIQEISGRDSFSDLQSHSLLAESYYEKSMNQIIELATEHKAKVISLNLPFAYTWNYGGHFSKKCEQSDVCVHDLKITFPGKKGAQGKENFSTLTSKELGLSQKYLDLVFPHPEYFLDVVHLSAQGHRKVSKDLKGVLQQNLGNLR